MKNEVQITTEYGKTIIVPEAFHFNTTWNNIDFIAVRNNDGDYLLQYIRTDGNVMHKISTARIVHRYIKEEQYIIRKI